MNRQLLARRQFLRETMWSLVGVGVAAASLDPLFSSWVTAEDLAPGTIYRATGFYESTGLGRESLVAMVLIPLNGAASVSIQDGTGLDRRDLGTGSLETFQARIGGLQRRVLFDHGALRAVVFSAKLPEGEYAEEKRYLFGPSTLDIENPRDRAARAEGHGSDGSSGGGSGGGSGGM